MSSNQYPPCEKHGEVMCWTCAVESVRPQSVHVDSVHPAGINPWHPMNDPVDLKTLGKLMEELNECGSAAARCLIQGINEAEPTTGKVNREWLEDEIADIMANANLVMERFNLDLLRIAERSAKKMAGLRTWHAMA